jgi:hypothetical protein
MLANSETLRILNLASTLLAALSIKVNFVAIIYHQNVNIGTYYIQWNLDITKENRFSFPSEAKTSV